MFRSSPSIELEYPFLWQALAVMLLAIITIGSLAPVSVGLPSVPIPNFDKVQHLVAYALLTAWYLVVFPGRYNTIAVPVFALGIGIFIEWLQGMTGYREASITDIAADGAGILLASVFLVHPLRLGLVHAERLIAGPQRNRSRAPRKRRSLKHRALWQIIGMHLAVALLISAFTPIKLDSIAIPHIDKIIHFTTYGGLTAWFLVVTRSRQIKVLVIMAMLMLSVSTEMLQGITRFGGEPSVLDALADAAGILLASFFVIAPLRKILLAVERTLLPKPSRRRSRRRRSVSI